MSTTNEKTSFINCTGYPIMHRIPNTDLVPRTQPKMAIFIFFFSKQLLNLIIVLCVVCPALVSYWRGTWLILDSIFLPDRPLLGGWITFSVSFGTIYVVVLIGDHLKANLNERKWRKLSYLALFYSAGFLIVNTWRGLWILWDHFTTTSLISGLLSHALGFFVVLSTQTTSSITAAPSYCITEAKDDELQTVFQGKSWLNSCTASVFSKMLNSFLTVFVTGAAVISYWRGTWVTMDALCESFGFDKLKSWIVSICIGCTLFVSCYFVSELVLNIKNLNAPYSWRSRTFEQVFVYILGFGTVNCWRGVWYVEDIYILPGEIRIP